MNAVELFVGAGGLGMAVSQAGFKPQLVVDWDPWACDTIRQNKKAGLIPFSTWPLVQGDVREVKFSEISKTIDIVTGGPPCQPFSMGGLHRAYLDERDMFPQAIRAVRELQPRAFVFENVKGLTRAAFSNYLEYIGLQLQNPNLIAKSKEPWHDHLDRLRDSEARGKLRGLRYKVAMKVLNAANYGVPQKRERVLIVGLRSDIDVTWQYPSYTHSQDALLWSQWISGEYWERHKIAKRHRPEDLAGKARALKLKTLPKEAPWVTVRDAIADLPDPEIHPLLARAYLDHRFQPGARAYAGHTGSPLDEPAKTLKAGVHGVPGGENMLRRTDGTVRYFTIRESARLQTFPDEMIFHGSWSETMRQLGNAVPTKLAHVIVQRVHDHLTRIA